MPEERAQRRLAAILAADVVGFSRLMEADEAGTLTALKARRKDVLEPLVAKHAGRVFKVTGDGVLVEFASAVNAVQCAVELQQAFAMANEGQPEDRRIALRIGVNLGDVMVEGGDLYGDGINIAARLEALAEPGGILISGTAHDHVGTKVKVGFDDIGPQTLKNIAQPVRAYRVTSLPSSAQRARVAADKPAIAVLPFTNMSGDPEQEYFSDGITEDIITELSRFHSLLVIARNSSFQYKGKNVDLRRVARELNVHYVVEGSVRKLGGSVRITVQLIDAETGNHLWAERYDRKLEDIFAIQDEIVAGIAARVAGKITVAGIGKARRKSTTNLAAYDYLLRAQDHFTRTGAGDTGPVIQLLQEAIKADPNLSQAYAFLAIVRLYHFWAEAYAPALDWSDVDKAIEAGKRAVELDGEDTLSHAALANALANRRSFDIARHHVDTALALNPNDAAVLTDCAGFENFAGRHSVALERLDQVKRLDPHLSPWYFEIQGISLYQLRRYAEAAESFERMIAAPKHIDRYLAACYAQMGRMDEARAKVAEALQREPGFTIRRFALIEPYKLPADLDHMIEGMRKAGLPE
jgi:TolB-like protein